jgi:hypothetical protein
MTAVKGPRILSRPFPHCPGLCWHYYALDVPVLIVRLCMWSEQPQALGVRLETRVLSKGTLCQVDREAPAPRGGTWPPLETRTKLQVTGMRLRGRCWSGR